MAITREQIFQTCDAIFSQGKRPTIELIRLALGSGSYSTIGKYLKEWRETAPDAYVGASSTELPQEIQNLAYDALKPVLAVIYAKISDDLESQRLASLEKENEEYQAQNIELAGLRIANRDLLQEIARLAQDLALAKAGIGIEQADAFQKLQENNCNLQLQLQECNLQLEECKLQVVNLHSEITVLQNQVQNFRNQRDSLQTENQELRLLKPANQDLQSQFTQLKAVNDSLTAQLGSSKKSMMNLAGEVVYVEPYISVLIEKELVARLAREVDSVVQSKQRRSRAKSQS